MLEYTNASGATTAAVINDRPLAAVHFPVDADTLQLELDYCRPFTPSAGDLWHTPGVSEFGGTFNGIQPTVERKQPITWMYGY